jgi:uncharacterized LabA/DUF88 family protein
MDNNRGYFIIDGSHLFSSIFELQRTKPEYAGKKLSIPVLTEALMRKWSLWVGSTIRVVYYFKQSDKRLKTLLDIPETSEPGKKDHWQIKECGEAIDAVPDEQLQKLDAKYRDHFSRSEKGLDGKLICDVLMLVANEKATNIVFLVNDRDYIPLFESIQSLGGNTYLTGLDSTQKIQRKLANLADKYLTLDSELDAIFNMIRQQPKIETTMLNQEIVVSTQIDSQTNLPIIQS